MTMNAEILKKVVNYDMQLTQFAVGIYTEAAGVDAEWTKLSEELLAFSVKFGQFVLRQREAGFTVTNEVPAA